MVEQTEPSEGDAESTNSQDVLSDEELCSALQDAAEQGDMADYDGLADEAIRRFTEYVAEGMTPRRESMIREFDTRGNPHVEIGPSHYDETFTSIDMEGALSSDGRPLMIDFFHGEPRAYVYGPGEETPEFTVRFPTAENGIDRPVVVQDQQGIDR